MLSPKKLFACPACNQSKIILSDVPIRLEIDSTGFVTKMEKIRRYIPYKEETFKIHARCDNIYCNFSGTLNLFLEPDTTSKKLKKIHTKE